MGRLTRWAASAALALLAAPAGASPVVVSFTGNLTTVSDPQGLLPAALAPGTSITGAFSYTLGASCQPVFQQPTTCEYIVSPTSLTLWLDTTPAASVSGRAYLFVQDGPLVDSFSASVVAPGTSGGSGLVWLSGDVQLSDPSSTAFSSTGLPTVLDLGGFAQHTFDAGGCYGGTCTGSSSQFQIAGTITSMQMVPEPGTGTLLAFGLLTFGGWRSRAPRGSRRTARWLTRPSL